MTYIISDTHSASAVVVLPPDLWMTAQHGLEWTQEFSDIVPIWTIEPDMSVMKAIAQPRNFLHRIFFCRSSIQQTFSPFP